MTDIDMELQRLRRENKALRERLEEAERIHQLDHSEIYRLRRFIETVSEKGE